eukprot:c21336_g1_i2.p1 GENE.c21336_g1_i2~~c21336_g1_i2.p1  ORF type:complete len:175 (+),score=5.10 c21336_g1_i2:46-570(+)
MYMKEFEIARFILESYMTGESNLFQDGLLSLRENMFQLVNYSKNNSASFLQSAQKIVLALNIVMRAIEKQDIFNSLSNLKFQDTDKILSYLETIYEIAKLPEYRRIIYEVQNSFVGNCILSANITLGEANRQLILLQYNQMENQDKIANAQEILRLAQDKYEKVSNFCQKYRLD